MTLSFHLNLRSFSHLTVAWTAFPRFCGLGLLPVQRPIHRVQVAATSQNAGLEVAIGDALDALRPTSAGPVATPDERG